MHNFVCRTLAGQNLSIMQQLGIHWCTIAFFYSLCVPIVTCAKGRQESAVRSGHLCGLITSKQFKIVVRVHSHIKWLKGGKILVLLLWATKKKTKCVRLIHTLLEAKKFILMKTRGILARSFFYWECVWSWRRIGELVTLIILWQWQAEAHISCSIWDN